MYEFNVVINSFILIKVRWNKYTCISHQRIKKYMPHLGWKIYVFQNILMTSHECGATFRANYSLLLLVEIQCGTREWGLCEIGYIYVNCKMIHKTILQDVDYVIQCGKKCREIEKFKKWNKGKRTQCTSILKTDTHFTSVPIKPSSITIQRVNWFSLRLRFDTLPKICRNITNKSLLPKRFSRLSLR